MRNIEEVNEIRIISDQSKRIIEKQNKNNAHNE